MHHALQVEQETDGRWIAEVPRLAGVLACGTTRDEAMAKARVLALRVLAALASEAGSRSLHETR